ADPSAESIDCSPATPASSPASGRLAKLSPQI
ncbi:hypothetical protein Y032_1451g3881, partial [Ancylostoma ceylanicum]